MSFRTIVGQLGARDQCQDNKKVALYATAKAGYKG